MPDNTADAPPYEQLKRENDSLRQQNDGDYERVRQAHEERDEWKRKAEQAEATLKEARQKFKIHIDEQNGPKGFKNQLYLAENKNNSLQQKLNTAEGVAATAKKADDIARKNCQDAYSELRDVKQKRDELQKEVDERGITIDELNKQVDEANTKICDADQAQQEVYHSHADLQTVKDQLSEMIEQFATGFSPQEYLTRIRELEHSHLKRQDSETSLNGALPPKSDPRAARRGDRTFSLSEEMENAGGDESGEEDVDVDEDEDEGLGIADGEPTLKAPMLELTDTAPWKPAYMNQETQTPAPKPARERRVEQLAFSAVTELTSIVPAAPERKAERLALSAVTEISSIAPAAPERKAAQLALSAVKEISSITPVAPERKAEQRTLSAVKEISSIAPVASTPPPQPTPLALLLSAPLHFKLLLLLLLLTLLGLYTSVLRERGLWLSANELTRQHVVALQQARGGWGEGWGALITYNVERWLEVDGSMFG